MFQGNIIHILSDSENANMLIKYHMIDFDSQLGSIKRNAYRYYAFDEKLHTKTDVYESDLFSKKTVKLLFQYYWK